MDGRGPTTSGLGGRKRSPWLLTTYCTSWWFQPIWKILVKLDHFPNFRGENKKSLKPPPSI